MPGCTHWNDLIPMLWNFICEWLLLSYRQWCHEGMGGSLGLDPHKCFELTTLLHIGIASTPSKQTACCVQLRVVAFYQFLRVVNANSLSWNTTSPVVDDCCRCRSLHHWMLLKLILHLHLKCPPAIMLNHCVRNVLFLFIHRWCLSYDFK